MDWLSGFTWSRVGSILTLAGTILIMIAVGRTNVKMRPVTLWGKTAYVPTFLRPGLFRFGIGLWIVGFLLQMIRGQ